MKTKAIGLLFVLGGIFAPSVVSAAEADFLECVKQEVCVLESDVTIDEQITLENDLVLDLNGHTITSTFQDAGKGNIGTSHTLTIKDSQGNGKFDASAAQGYAFYAYDGGTLILESGEIISKYAPFSGNNTTGDMNFIINGGTLTALDGAAIFMPGQGTLEINDGTLNGGINIRMGQVTINGGTIINNNPKNTDPIEDYYKFPGNVWLSDAIAVLGGTYTSGNSEYGNSLNMTINGGTFESKIGNALTIYALGKVEQDLNLTINGGTFNGKEISVAIETPETLELKGTESEIAEYSKVNNDVKVVITDGSYSSNVESLVADGYKVVENNGLYTVQPNLVIATDDEDVTFESDEPISNDYKLVVEKEELANEEAVMESVNEQITTALEETKEELLDSKLVATYDISVKDSNDQVVKLENGNYAISIKVTEDQVKGYNAFKVVYINDEGEVAEILDAVLANGVITFETTHLSTYAIIGYNTVTLTEDGDDVIGDGTDTPTTPETPSEETPEVPQTFDSLGTYVMAGVVSIVAIVGAVIYIKRRQTN